MKNLWKQNGENTWEKLPEDRNNFVLNAPIKNYLNMLKGKERSKPQNVALCKNGEPNKNSLCF